MRAVNNLYRTTEKGFTLTELIVILAVIAILAAMIIPSFFGVDEKAIEKSDENTVEVLNTSLDSGAALKKSFDNVSDVRAHLKSSGYGDSSLKPQSEPENKNEKYCFIWDKSLNSILMVNAATDEVLYPEALKGTVNDGDWYFVEKEPTLLDDCSYPSVLKIAREYFAGLPQTGGAEDKFYAVSLKISFEYDGVTFERAPQVAWAMYEANGRYEDGTQGPRLGAVNVCNALNFLKYVNGADTACSVNTVYADGTTNNIVGLWIEESWTYANAVADGGAHPANCTLGKYMVCTPKAFTEAGEGTAFFTFNYSE